MSDFDRLFKNFEECPDECQATIQGTFPTWINGILLRNGPGMFQIGEERYNHWFDGLALLQKFRIHNGEVLCSTKFLRSDAYCKNMAAQRIVVSEFGTLKHPDPCKSVFNRYFSFFWDEKTFTDNDVVNIVQAGDEIYAVSEVSTINRIDPVTLDVAEQVRLDKYVSVNTATAHPHYDRDGNIYNMGSAKSDYCIIKVPASKDATAKPLMAGAEIVARIPTSHRINQSYYHSFGMSEHFVILPEMSLLLNIFKLLTVHVGMRGGSYSDALEWHDEFKPVFHVVDMRTGTNVPIKYTAASAFFTFHHINAFEVSVTAGGDGEGMAYLVVDCVVHESGSVIFDLSLDNFDKWVNVSTKSKAGRFVLPLIVPNGSTPGSDLLAGYYEAHPVQGHEDGSGLATSVLQADGSIQVTPEFLSDMPFEFPRINYGAVNGRNYRYCYGTGMGDGTLGSQVLKFDFEERTTKMWKPTGKLEMAGEPVFVEKPGATAEDDGVILVPVTDAREDAQDYLLCLDGHSFEELGRAFVMPRLPLSFHAHMIQGLGGRTVEASKLS